MDSRIKRQGEYIEKLGHYDPMAEPQDKVTVKLDRVQHWVDLGAQATNKVASLLKQNGLNLAAANAGQKKKVAS